MKNSEINRVLNYKYDFGTGIWPYINSKFEIKLNDFGEYQTYIKSNYELAANEIKILKSVNTFLTDKNESKIASDLFSKISNIKYDNNIGYYLNLYVGHVVEGDFRQNGSSGGFGTWILTELKEKNYVDKIIHVKKGNDVLYEYSISTSSQEITEGSKTKYYPVEMSKILDYVKNNPGRYAIVGLPNFISELRLLCDVDTVLKERILFMIGLVCGHQKSAMFADFLAWQCGICPGNLLDIKFRKKLEASDSNDYGIEVKGYNAEGKIIEKTIKMSDLYGGDWGKGLFKIKASDYTDDVMNETADIVLGDAWLPEYSSDHLGNNILVVRNKILLDIIEQGKIDCKINIKEVDSKKIFESQSAHYRHTRDELGYRLYRDISRDYWVPNKRVAPSDNISYIRRKIQDTREEIRIKGPILFQKSKEKNDFNYFKKKMRRFDKKYNFYYFLLRVSKKIKK